MTSSHSPSLPSLSLSACLQMLVNICMSSLRNEFNFWKVHGDFTLTLQETRSIHDSRTFQKLDLLLIVTFYYK